MKILDEIVAMNDQPVMDKCAGMGWVHENDFPQEQAKCRQTNKPSNITWQKNKKKNRIASMIR